MNIIIHSIIIIIDYHNPLNLLIIIIHKKHSKVYSERLLSGAVGIMGVTDLHIFFNSLWPLNYCDRGMLFTDGEILLFLSCKPSTLLEQIWYQQEDVLWYIMIQTWASARSTLNEFFSDHTFSNFSDISWRPKLSHFSAPNFFLWEYFKGKYYKTRVKNVTRTERKIREEIFSWFCGCLEQIFCFWMLVFFKEFVL